MNIYINPPPKGLTLEYLIAYLEQIEHHFQLDGANINFRAMLPEAKQGYVLLWASMNNYELKK